MEITDASHGAIVSSTDFDNDLPTVPLERNSKLIKQRFAHLRRVGCKRIYLQLDHTEALFEEEEFYLSAGNDLVDCLRALDSVQLSLIGWYLNGQVLRNISAGFGSLCVLRLHGSKLGPVDCRTVALAMQSNSSIKTLDLSHNQIVGVSHSRGLALGVFDPSGLTDLLSVLERCAVADVDLSGNYLGGIRCTADTVVFDRFYTTSGIVVAKLLGKFLCSNRTVTTLNLNSNEFNDDDDEIAELLLSHLVCHEIPRISVVNTNGDKNDILGSNSCGCEEAVRRSSRLRKSCDSVPELSPCATSHSFSPPSFSSFSSSFSSRNSSAILGGSPCKTLCGIQLVSLKADYHNLHFSSFRPTIYDLVDLSNRCLDSATGRLLGAESCFKSATVTAVDLSKNPNFRDEGLRNFILSYKQWNVQYHLKSLNLRNIGLESGKRLPSGLYHLCQFLTLPLNNVVELDLSENPLFGDDGVKTLFEALVSLERLGDSCLERLNLAETRISSRASAQHISKFLSDNKCLRALDLSRNFLNCQDLITIAFGLKENTSLRKLLIEKNRIQGAGLKSFSRNILSSQSCTLTHLSLSSNVLCGNRDLKSFNPEPVIVLADALSDYKNRSLTYLDLSKSDIGARSARKLMETLKYNDTLMVLDISGCNITEVGGVAVGEMLPNVKSLRVLHLERNFIGPVGCKELFFGLAENKSLTWLDVSSNSLTGFDLSLDDTFLDYEAQAVVDIAIGISRNTSLKYLNLGGNCLFRIRKNNRLLEQMDMDNIRELTAAIKANGENGGALTTLNVSRNMMRKQLLPTAHGYSFVQINCVQELIGAAEQHPHLQSLCGLTPCALNIDASALFCSSSASSSVTTAHYPSTSISMADEGVDDLMMKMIAYDLTHNHSITSLNLENNFIMRTGFDSLSQALRTNVSLKVIHYGNQAHDGSFQIPIGYAPPNYCIEVEKAKYLSFQFRITLAVFVRGVPLGPAVLRLIIETLIGPGPQVARFLTYRNNCVG